MTVIYGNCAKQTCPTFSLISLRSWSYQKQQDCGAAPWAKTGTHRNIKSLFSSILSPHSLDCIFLRGQRQILQTNVRPCYVGTKYQPCGIDGGLKVSTVYSYRLQACTEVNTSIMQFVTRVELCNEPKTNANRRVWIGGSYWAKLKSEKPAVESINT